VSDPGVRPIRDAEIADGAPGGSEMTTLLPPMTAAVFLEPDEAPHPA
jgi:hypothetical protein